MWSVFVRSHWFFPCILYGKGDKVFEDFSTLFCPSIEIDVGPNYVGNTTLLLVVD
jgi:hypothetical protein